jgi:hypothetical protein
MTDYLLKFPSREAAVQFGLANGFATIDEDGNEQITLASHEYALCIVGEHNGDGQWWVLFRDLVGIPIPEGGEQFIHWASTSGEQRPTEESTPNIFWA